jgi:uncharacterized damage-inducible protein DinB
MDSGIQFTELLDYSDEEARRWQEFFVRYPQALDLPFDVAGTVRELVLHIFSVELHFANLVSGAEDSDPKNQTAATLGQLFAISADASRKYRQFFSQATAEDWGTLVQLGRINVKASKRKLVTQALTHSLRHWAQLATYLRQQGFKQDWRHDFLLTKAME